LGSYTANPSLEHYRSLKQILRYLAGTKDFRITYQKSQDDNNGTNLFHGLTRNYGPNNEDGETNIFHGFADAAFANADDYKSTTGYVFLVVGGAITWKSKKQTIIAMSSTESEYVALSEAGHEAFWLKIFMMNLASHRWDRQSSKATMKVQLFYPTTLNSMCGQNTSKYITIGSEI